MRDPVFEMESVTGSSYSARFRADADLDWFRGHFEGLPVLPGIAQVYFVTLALCGGAGSPDRGVQAGEVHLPHGSRG